MLKAIALRTQLVHPDQVQGQSLRLVPIVGPSHIEPEYRLLGKDNSQKLSITEINEGGSVPELHVHNQSDSCVFLMDGQMLIGAKQNRMLNTDVLVPANTTIKIPVSCVEQGRWRHVSRTFSPGKSVAHRTRSAKMQRVHESLKAQATYDADQLSVWREVDEVLATSKLNSPTKSLSDAFDLRDVEMTKFRKNLRLPPETVGLAAFHGSKFQGLDLFDRHSTLQAFWESLVDSYSIEMLEEPVDTTRPQKSTEGQQIQSILNAAAKGNWESFKSPGEGTDWRLENRKLSGSALVWEDKVVLHLQIFPRQKKQRARRQEIDFGLSFPPRM